MAGQLQGKVAVVTGAGGGIGRAYAHALAAEGAKIVVNDFSDSANTVVQEIEAKKGSAVANRDDVSNFAAAGNIIQAAIDSFGRIDVLVANAGIGEFAPLASLKEEHFDELFRAFEQMATDIISELGRVRAEHRGEES